MSLQLLVVIEKKTLTDVNSYSITDIYSLAHVIILSKGSTVVDKHWPGPRYS